MPDLSIKDVPTKELETIRAQAKRNHRSLQGELRAIISEAARRTRQLEPTLSLSEAIERIKKINLKTSSDAVRMVREDRDGR